MKIAVIFGGRSGEHEISLVSATAIARELCKNHKLVLIGISKDGRWFLQDDVTEKFRNDSGFALCVVEKDEKEIRIIPGGKKNCFALNSEILEADVVFPVLHGTYGEDGTIQGLFEMADIPYIGAAVLCSALTMDKEKTKHILEYSGVKTVPYICLKRCDIEDSVRYDEILKKAVETLNFPIFVKPCRAGSSNGASRTSNEKELSFAIAEAFRWDDKVLLEKVFNVREIECSVTGNSVTACDADEIEGVKAYIPGEVIPTHKFYDYDAKYNDPNGAVLKVPAELSTDMLETVRAVAVKAYKAVDGAGLCRVDFFIDKDSGELYLNEINSMPGFTEISMFPKMCQKAGLTFLELTELLIKQAVSLYESKKRLQTIR